MRRLLTSGIFVVFCFLTVVILAQVPQLLNYQGRLTDDAGTPIITTTTVRFSLYQGGDAATPGSGTLCYQEDASVTPDDNGVFSHLIGSGSVIFGALDSTVFQTADPVYLEITVDPAGANETLLPRKQIVTVGYSFKSELADDADTVDGQDASAFAPVGHNHDADYVNEGQANSVTSSMIADGTIVDADINAGANIAASKINPTGLDADLLDGKDSEDFVHTAGDDMTGTLNVNTATQYALYGVTSHTSGMGIYGEASAAGGYGVYGIAPYIGVFGRAIATSGTAYGVFGISDSTSGRGLYGYATASTGANYGVYGESDSTSGRGVCGYASASIGGTYGVYGLSSSNIGSGVYGHATATSGENCGVYGLSVSTSGFGVRGSAPYIGVFGRATATSGTAYGVFGISESTSGRGLYGYATATSGTNWGVYGISASTDGYGVYGYATASTGTTYGVYGESKSTDGIAVYGYASATSGTTYGVYGQSDSTGGYGVYGTAPARGVYGNATDSTGTTYGVYGITLSNAGTGVYGIASATSGTNYGVRGLCFSISGYGVYGHAYATIGTNYGVYGESASTSGYGVWGQAPFIGIYAYATATSGTNYGVYGRCSSGYAGYFWGNAHVTGNFTVAGTKDCVQPIDNGKKVLLYAMESPEIWFEDFGTAQLVNGQAVVQLENVFAQTANIEMGYLIFLTPIGECQGLYISRKDKESFEVRELGGGTSSISFDYRIVAKRRGYEEVRFEEFTEPEQPPAEPNLPMEKK